MNPNRRAPYNVNVPRNHLAIAARSVLAAFVFLAASPARSSAEPALVAAGSFPVLRVQLQTGNLTIRTWNRDQVAIDTQGRVNWQLFDVATVANTLRGQIPAPAETLTAKNGATASLPYEVFQMPTLSGGGHEAVIVGGSGDTTITLPAGAAFIFASVGRGSVDVQGYRGGFFTAVRNGGVQLRDVSGSGFVQVLRGPIAAYDSTFDRLRVRNGVGNMFFARCTSTQIEATSLFGNIVYDNGSFTPGLARFETLYGNVALGVGNGGAQIGAHSNAGRVETSFNSSASVANRDGGAQAVVGGGGAHVTASSQHGSVLLYDGTLSDHPSLVQSHPGMGAVYRRANAAGGLRPITPARGAPAGRFAPSARPHFAPATGRPRGVPPARSVPAAPRPAHPPM
jgi:hypothetical protein